jgi:hypothetical protein
MFVITASKFQTYRVMELRISSVASLLLPPIVVLWNFDCLAGMSPYAEMAHEQMLFIIITLRITFMAQT